MASNVLRILESFQEIQMNFKLLLRFGMTLLELYKKEFQRAIINQSVEKLIETGKIQVNGQIKDLNYVIKNGDRISHTKHRHEIPVLADKIKVIHEDQDYLVVDKPCSVPIHPCGKFRYNTLSVILIKEMRYQNLRSNCPFIFFITI